MDGWFSDIQESVRNPDATAKAGICLWHRRIGNRGNSGVTHHEDTSRFGDRRGETRYHQYVNLHRVVSDNAIARLLPAVGGKFPVGQAAFL